MSTLGMGVCGIGSTACGVGYSPPANTTAARVLLRVDGTRGDCARINVETGDFVLNATGEKEGWDATAQRVYLALRTQLGSSAVASLGIDLPRGGVLSDGTFERIRNAVLAALDPLVTGGAIVVLDVRTTRSGTSGVQTIVTWRDARGVINTSTI